MKRRQFDDNLFALQNAVKSIKPIVKNLSEMDKELDSITQVTTVGDLRSKLIEAEEAKVEVEAVLLERVICGKGNFFLAAITFDFEFCFRMHCFRKRPKNGNNVKRS